MLGDDRWAVSTPGQQASPAPYALVQALREVNSRGWTIRALAIADDSEWVLVARPPR